MSFQAKRKLLVQTAPRYREANHSHKSLILDEVIAATGYARKYAIRLLTQPLPNQVPTVIARPRAPKYGPQVQQALKTVWAATNFICAKRLVPFLPELGEALEQHGYFTLTPQTKQLLLSLSPATPDRILQATRKADRPHGLATTKAGTLLKHQVPVRTFAECHQVKPGFLEIDLVAHCGNTVEGSFLYTLTLTDVATDWTECQPLLNRGQPSVVEALERVRLLIPFPILGLDSDNGSEFLNTELIALCKKGQNDSDREIGRY